MAVAGGGSSMYLRPLRAKTADGRWVVHPAGYEERKRPAIELTSPRIDHDAALFDRLSVRLRVVHPEPLEGSVVLTWDAGADQPTMPVAYPDTVYGLSQEHVFTGDWQTIEFVELRPRQVVRPTDSGSYEPVLGWLGTLQAISVELRLTHKTAGQVGPADIPAAVELDWIVLTGVEEQLSGELPPPTTSRIAFGSYFAPPFFSPLADGIGQPDVGWCYGVQGDLADLDADGDLDLVAAWETDYGHGWVAAYNEGSGQFAHPLAVRDRDIASAQLMGAADLDQDGTAEVIAGEWSHLYVLTEDADEAWVATARMEAAALLAMADVDADGHRDVLAAERTDRGVSQVLVLLSRPGGLESLHVRPYADGEWAYPLRVARGISPAGGDGILWQPPRDQLRPDGSGNSGWGTYLAFTVTYLDAGLVPQEQRLEVELDPRYLLYVGDTDRDGRCDLVVSDELSYENPYSVGITCLHSRSDGFARVAWDPEARLRTGEVPQLVDLDDDGQLDLVYCDTDPYRPAVVVHRGQPGTAELIPEGRYPVAGGGGQVLPGDVDNDGDIDLVVLEPARYDTGGVHVLLSQLADRGTAVTDNAGPVGRGAPATPQLDACYPNPFNAGTTLAISLPKPAENVSLVIHNVLGQPVRTLVQGAVDAGAHRVAWDGNDDAGRPAGTGVYFARLRTGGWEQVRKMAKAE